MHGGIEWLVDGRGCAPARLRDRASVVALLDRIVRDMDLHVVSTAVHVFDGHAGVTALYLLAESHLTIHTFPESGASYLETVQVWMDDAGRSSIPSPEERPLRPRRPRRRANAVSASRQSSQTTVPSSFASAT